MENEKYIWERDHFKKDPYRIPDHYFDDFANRLMERVNCDPGNSQKERKLRLSPWVAWVSGIAAILVVGWLGFNSFYRTSAQETRLQENLSFLVDYYGEELHEGQLAGFLADNGLFVGSMSGSDLDDLIQVDPGLAEEIVYESVGY
jgi:hypothetical protein